MSATRAASICWLVTQQGFGLGGDALEPYRVVIERWLCPDVYKNQDYSVAKARKPIADYKKALEVDPQYALAYRHLASAPAHRGQLAGALENLLTLIQRDRRYRDDGARRAVVTLFQFLGQAQGPQQELIHECRRRLQLLL